MTIRTLTDEGFSAEEILEGIFAQMSTDEFVFHTWHFLNDRGVDIPEDIDEHFRLHCI